MKLILSILQILAIGNASAHASLSTSLAKQSSNSQPSYVSSAISESISGAHSDETGAAISLQDRTNQDPYVKASPLSVAAVCSDGIALISLHHGVDDDCDKTDHDELKLKLSSNTQETLAIDGMNKELISSSREDTTEQTARLTNQLRRVFRDLPMSTRGPLRIEQIYNHATATSQPTGAFKPLPPPMAILTAGWRTDGMTLASAARDLVTEERMLYCLPHLAMFGASCDDTSTRVNQSKLITDSNPFDDSSKQLAATQPYYGRRIAEGLSYYLAKCDFSESARSLSTVGLLAVGNNDANGGGSIFLIDATGSYRVRAHSIGAGASALNRRMGCIDFRALNCLEGVRLLLKLIAEEAGLMDEQSSQEDETSKSRTTENPDVAVSKQQLHLQQNNAIEVAIIKNGDGFMKRVQFLTI